jgi:hypothetical protein
VSSARRGTKRRGREKLQSLKKSDESEAYCNVGQLVAWVKWYVDSQYEAPTLLITQPIIDTPSSVPNR